MFLNSVDNTEHTCDVLFMPLMEDRDSKISAGKSLNLTVTDELHIDAVERMGVMQLCAHLQMLSSYLRWFGL